MGVANKRSIAWGIAEAFRREGAELAFTYASERLRENVEELVKTLPDAERIPLLPCDVAQDAQVTELFRAVEERWGRLDVLVHSIAFAPREELTGAFRDTTRQGFQTALDVSAYSLVAVTRAAAPLFERAGGGSVMTLTYDAVERVVPSYNVMAIAKAALEAEVRYLAADLGPNNVRVNAISAGPIKTLAASAVKGISRLQKSVEDLAPLRRNVTQEEVGDVAVFLASPLSRCLTGATLYADCGFNVVGKGHEV
ncbi:MAG: enoyl-ACP reductase [Planctomycetes bacterium]|nr:enoyl-ACP reductase [Planctomycetota bacterium]